nr:hypothetical protein [Tanacetum cinerariifolium]
EDRSEVTLPPQKRLDIALGPRYEVGESSSAASSRPAGGYRADYGFVAAVDREIMRDPEREVGYGITDSWDEIVETLRGAPDSTDTELGGYVREFELRVRQDMDEIYTRLDDEQTERQLLAGRLNMLFRDRRAHAHTLLLMKAEARMSREAWTRATDASDLVHGEVISLRTTVLGADHSPTGIGDSLAGTVETLQGAPVSTDTELGRYMREFETRVRQDMEEIYMRLDDEQKARMSREAWLRSTDASDLVRGEVMSLRTTVLGQMTEIKELQAADRRRQTVISELLRADHGRSIEIIELRTALQGQAMIDQGVTAVLAARDALRSTNGDDSHNSRSGVRRTERAIRECTYTDFLKCQPLPFKGTEGVASLSQLFERMESVFHISNCAVENQVKFATCILHSVALTWWNMHVKKLEMELWDLKVKGTDLASYTQRYQELALLYGRMFSEESDKIETYIGGLPDMIHGSVVASKPKTIDDGSLDVGSSGVIVLGYDGLRMMQEDTYAYVEAAMQEPPSPDFVSEPAYPDFMPPKDDVFPAEEQPLHVAVSPTADSPESSRDDTDNEEGDKDEDKEEEEEHLAMADSVLPLEYRTTTRMSIRAQTPIPFSSEVEVDRLLAIPTLPPLPLTSYSSPLPQIPSLPLPTSPTNVGAPLGYKAAMIRLRAESPYTFHPLPLPLPPPIVLLYTRASMIMMRAVAPSTYILAPRLRTPPSRIPLLLLIPLPISSAPLLIPSTECRADVPEVTLSPRKRLCIALDPRFMVRQCSSAPTARPTGGFRANYGFEDPDEIAEEIPVTDVTELGQRKTDFVTTIRQDTYEIYQRLDDAQDEKLLMSGIIFSYDLKKMAPTKRTIRASPFTKTTTTPVTNAQFKALIDQSVSDALKSHVKKVGQDAAHSMPWNTLMKMMTAKMFLEESDKIKKYVDGLLEIIHGSVMASKPKTMQDAVEFATELMDKKIYTFNERKTENKRKFKDTLRNNQNQQQQNKRQNSGRAYTARISTNANTANNQRGTRAGQKATCFECRAQGHFKRECPKLKNNNRGNQDGNGNAPAKVYVVGNAGTNPDFNVVTDHYYDVELADRRIIGLNTIIRGCTLNLLNHPFNIDLMPVELGSFDVIFGMDWLAKYHVVIVCDEKIVYIPYKNKTLIVRGDGSNRGNETRLNIISCTKMQKYMLKGGHVFLAHVTTKKTEDKSEGK